MHRNQCPLIITGPTASGKTDLAECIAQRLGGEVINIDVGQFYTPLTIGTAKPEWQKKPFACHLFDIIDIPVELSVAAYRSRIVTLVNEIYARGKLPIIVGGSLFYVKSLFFPPHQHLAQKNSRQQPADIDLSLSAPELWNILNELDSVRAQAIHPNDHYRIVRALQIWLATGEKPSSFAPIFAPPFSAHVVFLAPPKDVLSQRITQRTTQMIDSGDWINEAKSLLGTEWERFVESKGIIGYAQIFAWLRSGLLEMPKGLIDDIAQETRQYAKRQMVFLKKLEHQLASDTTESMYSIASYKIEQVDDATVDFLQQILKS